MKSDAYVEPCRRIWEGYKLYASCCGVARKGFELGGQTCATSDEICAVGRFWYRGESDLEHQAKVAWLCSVFYSNFSPNFSMLSLQLLFDFSIAVALMHDTGEIMLGDIPDDGRLEHGGRKDEVEREFFKAFVESYHPSHRDIMFDIFRGFQDKNSCVGQVIYALDKAEFVLMALFLEKYGIHGSLKKRTLLGKSDEHFMQMIDTDDATDCWAAHTKILLLRSLPETISGPVLTLIDVAVRDVRGKPFAWWNDVLVSPQEK